MGTNDFGGQIDEETSVKIANRAFDCGINVLDTANIYTGGKSEEVIGKTVKGRRDEVVIAIEVGSGRVEGPNRSGLSRKHSLNHVERSLKS